MASTTIDINEDHKPLTKSILKIWLVKFGIPEDRIFEPAADEIQNAPQDIRLLLENMLIVPYKYSVNKPDDGASLLFEAKVTILRKWINVKLMIIRHEEIPPKMRLPLYERILKANFDLNEVTFSLSQSADVFVEADMPVGSDYYNFESEYGSVEFGVDYFLTEIVPTLSEISVTDTFNPDLYI
jgi:hypothetical protein